jgi:hemin uptake protein HemP
MVKPRWNVTASNKDAVVSVRYREAPDEHCWRRRAGWRRLAELARCADYRGENAAVNDLLTLSLKIITFLTGVPDMDPEQRPSDEHRNVRSAPPPRDARSISSDDLMQGESEIQITHRGETYRLRVTRAGKLILQK